MITIELNEHTAEDWKLIQELIKDGVPEELIQQAYRITLERREENEVKKDD